MGWGGRGKAGQLLYGAAQFGSSPSAEVSSNLNCITFGCLLYVRICLAGGTCWTLWSYPSCSCSVVTAKVGNQRGTTWQCQAVVLSLFACRAGVVAAGAQGQQSGEQQLQRARHPLNGFRDGLCKGGTFMVLPLFILKCVMITSQHVFC